MSVSTLSEIRPLSGAAAAPGPEADLAARFVKHAEVTYSNAILAPEVPIPNGVVDLLRLQFAMPQGPAALHGCRPLGRLADRALFGLSALRPNQRYTFEHLERAKMELETIVDLADLGLVEVVGDAVVRPAQLVDHIDSVTSYEFKITDITAGLRQAALRRPAVTRSYLVTTDAPIGAFPATEEFRRLGVGWISVGDRTVRHIGSRHSRSPRWARLLMLRAIVRGLERQISSDRLERI